MNGYNTVKEKSGEWNITSRHIQYLCRNGKIEGAVKRVGSWFIPTDAPNPAQNTKKDAEVFNFAGTKSKVFNSAIQLFMLKGFNDVSLRDIANSVGIQQSTIYNHFSSKQEILDTIYDFFCHYYQVDRPSLREMEQALRTKSLLEIIRCMRYNFKDEYREKLTDILKIVFQRIAIDERAREICKKLFIEDGIRYVEMVLRKGIEIGRFAPFDVHAMAVFINGAGLFTLVDWIVDPSPENVMRFTTDEQALYEYSTRYIKDLKSLDSARWGAPQFAESLPLL